MGASQPRLSPGFGFESGLGLAATLNRKDKEVPLTPVPSPAKPPPASPTAVGHSLRPANPHCPVLLSPSP